MKTAIKSVRKYQTTDGALHDHPNLAHNHQLKIQIYEKIKAAYHPTISTNRADSFILSVLNDPKDLRDMLTRYIQCTRKTPEVEYA